MTWAGAVATGAGAASSPRSESPSEWRADALVHLVGVVLGVVACVVLALMAWSVPSFADRLSLGIYGAALLAMLGCSARYNIKDHDSPRTLWRRLDHAAIFLMIAGTYTPFAAIAIGGAWGMGLLIFVWTMAGAGAALKLWRVDRSQTLSTIAYLTLGWTILVATEPLLAAVSPTALVLLAAGGILYSVGVVFYRWHALPYHRAIWHGLVLTAAACHYLAILDVVAG